MFHDVKLLIKNNASVKVRYEIEVVMQLQFGSKFTTLIMIDQ
jgi:hypothetical protein